MSSTSHELADEVLRFCRGQLELLSTMGGDIGGLPAVIQGQRLGDDALVDYAYVSTLLGVLSDEVRLAGDGRHFIGHCLEEIRPELVDGFHSFRLADAIELAGGLGWLTAGQRELALAAAYPSRLLKCLAKDPNLRHRNWLVVAARCLDSMQRLGVPARPQDLSGLDALVTGLFSGTSTGWINDSATGSIRYDIYTPEMYLLAFPFRERLGSDWLRGFGSVIRDLGDLCRPEGLITWGRSTGVLSQAMTLSIAGAVANLPVDAPVATWLGRAECAFQRVSEWFDEGLVVSLRGRASDPYRGPRRIVQLTLDVLAKLLEAARFMKTGSETIAEVDSALLWPDVDRLVQLDEKGRAHVWTYRSPRMSFVLPLMDETHRDYLTVPMSPGVFDAPTTGVPVMIPVYHPRPTNTSDASPDFWVPCGPSSLVEHNQGSLSFRQEGWARTNFREDGRNRRVGGAREVRFRVLGRTLSVEEVLVPPVTDEGLELGIAVASNAPCPITVSSDTSLSVNSTPISGMENWWSRWSSPTRAWQVSYGEHARAIDWQLTRALVIASSDPDHPYNRALYSALGSEFTVISAAEPNSDLRARLRGVDVFHMAWPERWSGQEIESTCVAIEDIRRSGCRIALTQHNLIPHRQKNLESRLIYQAWAEAADIVFHHSEYGMRVAKERLPYSAGARHVLIPHGHSGRMLARYKTKPRSFIEQDEGWGHFPVRIAVVGQPRPEKELAAVIDAAMDCGRDDIQFVLRVGNDVQLRSGTPRVVLERGHLSAQRYYRRFAAIDALLMPFLEGDMLATGTAFDCIGAEVAAICSDWEFLQETFGQSQIVYGSGADQLRQCLAEIQEKTIRRVAEEVGRLRQSYDWDVAGRIVASELTMLIP